MSVATSFSFSLSADTYATEYDSGGGGYGVNGSGFNNVNDPYGQLDGSIYVTANEYSAWLDTTIVGAVSPVGDDAGYGGGQDNLSVTAVDTAGTSLFVEGFSTAATTYAGITTYDVTSNASLVPTVVTLPGQTGTFFSSLDTTTRYGPFGEDLDALAMESARIQDIKDTTTGDVTGYVTALFTELITDSTNARAEIISGIVDSELAYQSGVTNERVVGPGIGGNSTVLDVVDGKSYVDLITSTALAVEGNDPAALAAIKNGLPNPFDYGFNLDTGIFASEEDAALYAQARVDNIVNVVGQNIDANITGYAVAQQFLISNPDSFTIRNADGTYQILPYTLLDTAKVIDQDLTTTQAVVIAIRDAGGVITSADLSYANLERIAEANNLGNVVNSSNIVYESVDQTIGGGDLTSRLVTNSMNVTSTSLPPVIFDEGGDTSLLLPIDTKQDTTVIETAGIFGDLKRAYKIGDTILDDSKTLTEKVTDITKTIGGDAGTLLKLGDTITNEQSPGDKVIDLLRLIPKIDLIFRGIEFLNKIDDFIKPTEQKAVDTIVVAAAESGTFSDAGNGYTFRLDSTTTVYASSTEVSTNNQQTLTSVLETARPDDFPSYANLTTEERAVLVDGLNDQIIRTADSTVNNVGSALEKAIAIQKIIDTDGYGLGLDQDQIDYLQEGLTNANTYATSYVRAYELVNSALDSIASIQQTDSSASVTQDRRSAADDLWNSLTPLEKQVARDSGLATELDQLLADPNGIIDSGNIQKLGDILPYGNGPGLGVQGAVDRAVAEFISQNGTITEEQYVQIEDAIIDLYRVEQTNAETDISVDPPGERQNFLVKTSAVDTSLTRAQSNASPLSPEPPAPVTQYQNYAAALEILREETGGKTASEWVAAGKLTETTPGSGVFSGTVPIAPGSSISVPLTVSQATIDAQQALIEQTTQQRQGLLNQGIPASTLDNPVNLEKAVAQQLPLADQVLSTTSAGAVSPDQASAGSGILVEPIPVQPIPQRQAQRVTSEQASAGSGSSVSTTTLALVAAASAVAVTNADTVVNTASNLLKSATSFIGGLFTSSNTTASASTTNTGDYGSDYTSEFALANSVGLDDITTSAGDVNGSDIYEWPTGADGSTPYDDDGNLNPGWELSENNDPVYVGFNKTDTPADVPVQDIYQYPSGPNGETPYDDDGNLNPGWGLDENNNPVYVGPSYIDQSLLDSAAASGEYAKKLLAQQQATLEAQRKLINNGDWRVRLSLAPAADYLYNTPGNGSAGILEPLRVTNGVLFPYTPQIDTQYRAEYDSYSLTHSNYKGYFYKSSHIDAVNITATFTAQDTSEAEYLLAVIHFFRSVTKMFYGQDPERGAPPPLVYLTGLGEYQFNGHPCVVTSFNYTLPADVDYIRARSKNVSYSNLLQRRDRQSLPTNLLTSALDRLFNAGVTKGAIPETQAPPTLGLNSPTYVPTKMQITISLLPVQSRSQVSKQFSLKQFANGNLLKGGFW